MVWRKRWINYLKFTQFFSNSRPINAGDGWMVFCMTFRQFVKPKIALITLRFFISKKKHLRKLRCVFSMNIWSEFQIFHKDVHKVSVWKVAQKCNFENFKNIHENRIIRIIFVAEFLTNFQFSESKFNLFWFYNSISIKIFPTENSNWEFQIEFVNKIWRNLSTSKFIFLHWWLILSE